MQQLLRLRLCQPSLLRPLCQVYWLRPLSQPHTRLCQLCRHRPDPCPNPSSLLGLTANYECNTLNNAVGHRRGHEENIVVRLRLPHHRCIVLYDTSLSKPRTRLPRTKNPIFPQLANRLCLQYKAVQFCVEQFALQRTCL